MSKFLMKAVAAASLAAVGSGAFAAVTISGTPSAPALYAKEIIGPVVGGTIALTNTGNVLDLTSAIGYTMSQGEVRTVRFELSNGAVFAGNATVAPLVGATFGAINGLGTSVITFSITATAVGGIPNTAAITILGDRSIVNTTSTVSASYGLYDQPSQGIAGGALGRITGVGPVSYLTFGTSYSLGTTATNAVADVASAAPAFSQFLLQAGTGIPAVPGGTAGNQATALLGTITYGLVAPATPLKASGVPITLPDLMAATTNITVTGDFSKAAGTANVYLSNTSACGAGTPATTLTAGVATFVVGAVPNVNTFLCYTPNGTAIPATTAPYAVSLNPVSATPATYAVTAQTGANGSITRNGTEIQAPLVQITPGYVSRIVLTNTGGTEGNYTIVVRGETGATLNTTGLTGKVPLGGMVVLDVSSFLTSITGGAPRAFITVTVDRPTTEIQGLYQIVNPTTGSISNTVMVRPGTN